MAGDTEGTMEKNQKEQRTNSYYKTRFERELLQKGEW